ncbi:MAG: hypothetical protein WC295_11570 [Methanoregula sp.]|jgi:hypothetical protein
MPLISRDCLHGTFHPGYPVCRNRFWYQEAGYGKCRDSGVKVTTTGDTEPCRATPGVQRT